MPAHPRTPENLPSDPSLEQLKKRAKTLQRQVRGGNDDALALARELHPRMPEPASFSRSDAQLVLARRYGFPSWPRLREHLRIVERYARRPHRAAAESDLAAEFLRLACLNYGDDHPSRRQRARDLLDAHPELRTASIHTAAACADVAATETLLRRDSALAGAVGGPHDWEPLCYLTYARLGDLGDGCSPLETARLLLAHGADPNSGYLWEGLPSPFTALTGAFGEGEDAVNQPAHPDSLALARLLLDAGADPNDSQALYNRQFNPANDHLRLLLRYGLGTGSGGPWHARLGAAHPTPRQLLEDQLLWAAAHDLAERVQLLLEHGVDPDGTGTAHPIHRGHSAYELAALSGNEASAELLRNAGATVPGFDPVRRLLSACLSGDRDQVGALCAEDETLVRQAIEREPGAVAHAVMLDRPTPVRLLLDLGFDINAAAGTPALHEAVAARNLGMVELLVGLGADVSQVDGEHQATPLEWARHHRYQEIVDYLASLPA